MIAETQTKLLNTAKVYILYNNSHCYIGSTNQLLKKRLQQHESTKRRITSSVIIKEGDYKIKPLETCTPLSRKELLVKERYWLDLYADVGRLTVCNKMLPCRTYAEWKRANYQRILAQKKQYRTIMQYCPVCDCNVIKNNFARHCKCAKHIKKTGDFHSLEIVNDN